MRTTGSHSRRAALIVGVIVGGIIVARAFGFTAYLRFENLSRLTETIEGYGVLGPADVWTKAAYVLGVVFFVPGLPVTLLAGSPSTGPRRRVRLDRGHHRGRACLPRGAVRLRGLVRLWHGTPA
jgi:hypothetical protein